MLRTRWDRPPAARAPGTPASLLLLCLLVLFGLVSALQPLGALPRVRRAEARVSTLPARGGQLPGRPRGLHPVLLPGARLNKLPERTSAGHSLPPALALQLRPVRPFAAPSSASIGGGASGHPAARLQQPPPPARDSPAATTFA